MYIYILSQRVDPKQWIYAIIVPQPFCNLYCAIFAMLDFFATFCWQYWKPSVFLCFFWTHIAKNTKLVFFATFCWKYGKPLVLVCFFFALRVQKHHKTYCFLHYFAEHAEKRWFSFVFWRSYCKKPWVYNDFLHLFHTNTYTSTLHHGRKATLRVS